MNGCRSRGWRGLEAKPVKQSIEVGFERRECRPRRKCIAGKPGKEMEMEVLHRLLGIDAVRVHEVEPGRSQNGRIVLRQSLGHLEHGVSERRWAVSQVGMVLA